MSAWRSVGVPGVFAAWVLELRGRSGVYAIRSARTSEVLYVGESHTDRLYQTLTRHMQSSSEHYKGPTYQRGSVEVKVELCRRGDDAIDLQYEWIGRLAPRDNELVPVTLVDDDEVPF